MMPSIYNDEERDRRYRLCRRKRDGINKVLSAGMIGIIFYGFIDVAPGLFVGAMNGLFYGEFHVLFSILFSAVKIGAAVYAIYARRWKHTLCIWLGVLLSAYLLPDAVVEELFLDVFLNAVLASLLPIIMTADILWEKLSEEEGFPLFEIPYEELEKRRQHRERISYHESLARGVRQESTAENAGMGDLLDTSRDTPVAAELMHSHHSNSFERPEIVMPAERARQQVYEGLDELEASASVPFRKPRPDAALVATLTEFSESDTGKKQTADPETDAEILRTLAQLTDGESDP